MLFQSTLSMRRATCRLGRGRERLHISIHALHEESDFAFGDGGLLEMVISIHALHEESDNWPRRFAPVPRNFNPRSP